MAGVRVAELVTLASPGPAKIGGCRARLGNETKFALGPLPGTNAALADAAAAAGALENRLPVINLVESGGADMHPPRREYSYPGRRMFRDLTGGRAVIPTIALVFANSTANGAIPARATSS